MMLNCRLFIGKGGGGNASVTIMKSQGLLDSVTMKNDPEDL